MEDEESVEHECDLSLDINNILDNVLSTNWAILLPILEISARCSNSSLYGPESGTTESCDITLSFTATRVVSSVLTGGLSPDTVKERVE